MNDCEKVIKGLEACSLAGTKDDCIGYGCPYLIYNDEVSDDCQEKMFDDAIALLKAREPMQNGAQHQCNECKYYEGVHNTEGHAPCKFWNIGGVMWNDYCSRFQDFQIGGEVGMADCMMFPDDWRDFLKDYSFVDSDEVYTNGSLLIPVFRVEQLIEHLLKAQEPRVMTLEEVDNAPFVWLESKKGGFGVRRIRIVPTDSTAVAIQTFGRADTFCETGAFEKEFRCWSACPTDEQRQNTPWKKV